MNERADIGPIIGRATVNMDDFKKALLGGDSVDDARRELRCLQTPIGCGEKLPQTTPFRDGLSQKEWTISGLCQNCQDKVKDED